MKILKRYVNFIEGDTIMTIELEIKDSADRRELVRILQENGYEANIKCHSEYYPKPKYKVHLEIYDY